MVLLENVYEAECKERMALYSLRSSTHWLPGRRRCATPEPSLLSRFESTGRKNTSAVCPGERRRRRRGEEEEEDEEEEEEEENENEGKD